MPASEGRERRRLAALKRSTVFDAARSPAFDALAEAARRLFGADLGVIGFLDSAHYRVKGATGALPDSIPREATACHWTVDAAEVTVVADMRADPRTAGLPDVVAEGGVRFYAGAPILIEPGLAIGTICACGFTPLTPGPAEIAALAGLAEAAAGLVRLTQIESELDAARTVLSGQRREVEVRERRLRQTERLARIGGWEYDIATGQLACSEGMLRICEVEEGATPDLPALLGRLSPRVRAGLVQSVRRTIRTGETIDGEIEVAGPSGRRRLRVTGDLELEEGRPRRVFGCAEDVTDRWADRMRLWQAANTDPVTGLGNRKRFVDLTAETFAAPPRGSDRVPGLLLIDIDHLKEVNDTLGHDYGDALIAAVGRRLAAHCGAGTAACRIGGDEFAVLVRGCRTPADLDRVATRVLEAMWEPIAHQGRTIAPSVTIGGALATPDGGAERMRRDADLALYKAKETRRGSYVGYRPGLMSSITRRTEQVRALDQLLGIGAVVPWYQPVVDLATGRLTGFEALARIRTPEGLLASVSAYRFGLDDPRNASRLTGTMMEQVAADLSAWSAAGVDVPLVGLNLTTADLLSDDLEVRLSRAFGSRGIPFERLVMEVTETVFLSSGTDQVGRTLRRLAEIGTGISLDDFGTGYASLTHLVTFPVDCIKIDRSFVARLSTDRASEAVVSSMLDLAAKLGLDVVAEGIESEENRRRLVELGCPYGQGYVFSRPIPARDVPDFVGLFGRAEKLHGPRRLTGAA